MVEEFFLPDGACALEGHVDLASRAPFDRLHDFGQAVAPAILTAEWGIDQVDVIGHNDGSVKVELGSILLQAAGKNDVSGFGWKDPAAVCGEGYEERVIVFLIMW